MKREVYLIRHGKTEGNSKGAYLGCRSDQPLSAEGESLAREKGELLKKIIKNPHLFASPLKRTMQTAALLFPEQRIEPVEMLREIDFGDWDGKTHAQLDGNEEYQAWIDSGGLAQIPGGESRQTFIKRCLKGFNEILADANESPLVIVCHGGTIMAILSELTGQDYYDFQVSNLDGYKVWLDDTDGKISLVSYNCIWDGDHS